MKKGWPINVINNINEMTTKILMRIEDPKRPGKWDRRGLVVGNVQAGKTADYIGLVCKAADSGYKVIVIFAGLHDSLRSQTQQRLDEDFIGFDTGMDAGNYHSRIGVGKIANHPVVHYVTTSKEAGDFSRKHANMTGLQLASNDPKILIVKKNKSIINNLKNWAGRMGRQEGCDRIRGVPLLVIDDECDNASVNTNIVPRDEDGNPVPDYDPTSINRGIRDFLNNFEQKAYVGYTATPFATILIHRQGEHQDIGQDLFPRDFIIHLPEPSNYIGPEKFFGIDEDPDLGIESSIGYPLYRSIKDYIKAIPDKHKKDLQVEQLPSSLKEAIKAYILSCAARRLRGQINSHNSMLIHVTRYTNVQNQISELVKEEISAIEKRLRYGDGISSKNIWDELNLLWDQDFKITSSKQMEESGPVHEWIKIKPEILPSVEKISILQVNGKARDVLAYKKYSDTGTNVIVIGGDKLSRGLTLEGLTVSYYLRSSRMYDTLMQMGRWFGYRSGYLDLCRIYTTNELISWYRHIALVNVELRREFDYMVENDEIPENYGLKIRSHPGALSVTAFNKMRNGTKMRVTFDGMMTQTLWIHNKNDIIDSNYHAVENLINGYQPKDISSIGYKFENVKPSDIIQFLSSYSTHPRNIKYKPSYLIDYIKKMNKERELTTWTVILLSTKNGPKKEIKINEASIQVGLTERTASEVNNDYIVYAKALLSPMHEKLDLTEDEQKKLDGDLARTERKGIAPKLIKKYRSCERGLLLLYAVYGKEGNSAITYGDSGCPVFGYVISFPESKVKRDVEYIVDSLYPDELEAV